MSLEINYKDTIRKAEQLESLADDIIKICNSSLTGLSNATRNAWTGDGGDRFRKRMNKCIKSLANNSRDLKNTASSLESKARRYEWIEKQAQNLFKF